MARAVLGPGPRIAMASFTGTGTGTDVGLRDGAAVWRSGGATGPCWLDIDFVPDAAGQAVQITLLSGDVQVIAAAVERGLIGLWVNGRELATDAPPATDPAPPPLRQTAPAAAPGNGNGNGNGNCGSSTQTTGGNPNGQGAVGVPDTCQMAPYSSITVDLRANDDTASLSSLNVFAINGVSITAGPTLTLITGQAITLNADKTVTIATNGNTGTFVFSYTTATGQGNGTWSTSTVTLNVIPCFVVVSPPAPGARSPMSTCCSTVIRSCCPKVSQPKVFCPVRRLRPCSPPTRSVTSRPCSRR